MVDPRHILRYRGLLGVLTSRELKARYRGSALGFVWSLVNPLLLLGVYTFVFSMVFQPRAPGATPYSLFLITGLFPWIWISTSLLEGANSLIANGGLIRKSVFPVELLPLVPVFSNLINFLLSLPVIAGGLLVGHWIGADIGGPGAVALPIVILLLLPFLSGLSLALAALTVHFKDVRDIVTNVLTLCFFLTPILYTVDSIPYAALRRVIQLNPFSPFIEAFRQCLFNGGFPNGATWLQMAVVATIGWLVGSWIFSRLSETLAEAV